MELNAQIAVRAPTGLKETLERIAAEERRRPADMIRIILENYITARSKRRKRR
jgi:predicted DNA-binding protein